MPQYCCVPQCTNAGGHRFPKDESLKLKWRVAIKRMDPVTRKLWMPSALDVVCRLHFLEDDYNPTLMGLIGIEELRDKVMKSRGTKSQDVSIDDLLRAIKKLKVLGNGFTVIPVGRTHLVQSVPGELTMDHTNLLQQAQTTGHVTKSILMKDLKWEEERASRALNFMIKEGLAWIDEQSPGEREYWFPSFFPDMAAAS